MKKHPHDWKQARSNLKEMYFDALEAPYKSVYNAVLNGACSVLALLYGEGDFQLTLDLCCAMGWDADNQAATICGLLAIAKGLDAIPQELLFPVESWEMPFNDSYINRTRHDLPDISIRELAERTAQIGEKIILASGGAVIEKNGTSYYKVNTGHTFTPALELHPAPLILFSAGEKSSYRLNSSIHEGVIEWSIEGGVLPEGIGLKKGILEGTAIAPGVFSFTIEARYEEERVKQDYTIHVMGQNKAIKAAGFITSRESKAVGSVTECPDAKPSEDIELLRDGKTKPEYYSTHNAENWDQVLDYLGYRWEEAQDLTALVYTTGWMEQRGGWFMDFEIEYQDAAGDWQSVTNLSVEPKQNLNDQTFAQTHYAPYLCRFEPVNTKAIRVIGAAAGKSAWNHPDIVHFLNISEIAVY